MYIILFTSDPTLTPENVLAELQEVQLWGCYESVYLDMPLSTHYDLIRHHGDGAPGKSALVNEYLSQHPYPRWGQIVDLLEVMEKNREARAGLAQEVKDKYMTSTCKYTISCIPHIQYASKKTSHKWTVQRGARSRSSPVDAPPPFSSRSSPVRNNWLSRSCFFCSLPVFCTAEFIVRAKLKSKAKKTTEKLGSTQTNI